VWNHVNLPSRNSINIAKKLGRQFAHHDEAVRQLCDLFKDDALICIGLAENRVECRHQRHLQFAKEREDISAGSASKDAIFMLQANNVVTVEVEKLRGLLIGCEFLLFQLQSNLLRIFVARVRIVDRNCKQAAFTKFGGQRVT